MRMIGALRARPRRMVSDTIRRALICLVVVGGCSSESSAPATTTTSSGDATEDITAEVERDRQFGTEGKLGLGFVNHTAAAQQLHDFALDSPLFEVVPPEADRKSTRLNSSH